MMCPSTTLRCVSVCALWVYTSRTQSQWILLTASERGRHGGGRWSRVNGWFILFLKCSSFSSYKASSAGWKWSGAREKSGKLRGGVFFFFFPSFWWRHPFDRVTVPPPLFPSVACHSFPVRLFTCLTCLQVAVCAIQILWQTLPQ